MKYKIKHEKELEPEQGATKCKSKHEKADENTDGQVGIETQMVISRSAARYAMYEDDLMLVKRFVLLLSSSSELNYIDNRFVGVTTDDLYKMLLRGVRLLHLCEYDYAD